MVRVFWWFPGGSAWKDVIPGDVDRLRKELIASGAVVWTNEVSGPSVRFQDDPTRAVHRAPLTDAGPTRSRAQGRTGVN